MSESTYTTEDYLPFVTEIVSAFVAKNPVRPNDLSDVISAVHTALANLMSASNVEQPQPVAPVPAVSVRRSVTNEAITCLICAKQFKSMKRHLSADHALTPNSYREMFGLKADYPMVCATYSAKRSELAKINGLGNLGGLTARAALPVEASGPKKRGRPPKVG